RSHKQNVCVAHDYLVKRGVTRISYWPGFGKQCFLIRSWISIFRKVGHFIGCSRQRFAFKKDGIISSRISLLIGIGQAFRRREKSPPHTTSDSLPLIPLITYALF